MTAGARVPEPTQEAHTQEAHTQGRPPFQTQLVGAL